MPPGSKAAATSNAVLAHQVRHPELGLDLDELDLGGILSSVRGGEGRLLDVVDAQDGHRVEIFFD